MLVEFSNELCDYRAKINGKYFFTSKPAGKISIIITACGGRVGRSK